MHASQKFVNVPEPEPVPEKSFDTRFLISMKGSMRTPFVRYIVEIRAGNREFYVEMLFINCRYCQHLRENLRQVKCS